MPHRFLAWVAAGWLVAAGVDSPARAQSAPPDFERQIRPILAGRCQRCHGFGKAEAGLKLTTRAGATAELESGNRAIVPRQPDQSELLRRVASQDQDERMPPQGEPLSGAQIELVRRWIAAGASWPEHWAYRPLRRSAAAADPAPNDWVRTPVDRHIAARLAAEGLRPNPAAEPRALLRRLYFDLTGMPPTGDDYAAFQADPSPAAYERIVDRLLASPRYGERWARHWMDLVHYAESHGQDQDRPREHAWPYRDYLIRSFNEDKPFDRFLQEQVAGDVLWPDDPAAIVATGMLATGPWDESSLRDIREDSPDREVARYLDRDDIVTTVLQTFASTTVQCARCHDHKFDPIGQGEYYALQAVFAGIDKANRPYDADPTVARRRRELAELGRQIHERIARRDAQLPQLTPAAELAAWEAAERERASIWRVAEVAAARSGGGDTLARQEDGSLLAAGPAPEREVYTVELRSDSKRVTGLRLELLAHDSLPQRGPGRAGNGNLHLSELRVALRDRRQADAVRRLALKNPRSDFDQEGWGVAAALDGNPNTAWGIHPAEGKNHVATFELAAPVELGEHDLLEVELTQVHGGGHVIGCFRLSLSDRPSPLPLSIDALPPAVSRALARSPSQRSPEDRWELAAQYWRAKLRAEQAALPAPSLVYCGTNRFEPDGSFRPAPAPREVRILARGNAATPLGVAQPAALSCVAEMSARLDLPAGAGEGPRRAALARWLADRRNGLVWRSIVNRVWQYHFGRGLVDTPNDFGQMGSPPTHPELLDELALSLVEHGGSLKWLHRLLVTSAVYRQSSQHRPQAAAVDGSNRWLWRMHRRRLDAEEIRDAALLQAGTLDARMGGPSDRQFIETPGVHVTPNVDYLGFSADAPANYRRSVYRFVFRTLPDPFMETLDCPDSSQLVPQRTESVTALQALATVNDKLLIRQSEQLARRIAARAGDLPGQVRALYRIVLGREPSAAEAALVGEYAGRHGLANACRFLWNSNEFMFVD